MMDLGQLKNRDEFGQFLTANGFCGSGVEVGVAYGEQAEKWLVNWPGTLLLVDPYERQDPNVYHDQTNQIDMEACCEHAKERLKRFGNRAVFVRDYSLSAAGRITDDWLDFAYIDANHSYVHVWQDLQAWWPKVKSGGIFAGHDFRTIRTSLDTCEVPKAIYEFGCMVHRPFWFTPCLSWWTVKP